MIRTVVHFDDSREFGGTEQAALHLMAGLERRGWRPVLFHHPGPGIAPLIDAARRLDIATRAVPAVGTRSEVRTGFAPFVRALLAERPAVFHAHLTTAVGCKYGLVAAALCRTPAVVGTLQLLLDVPPDWRYDASQRLVTACVHRYLAVSEAIAAWMRRRFRVAPRKLEVVPNAVTLPVRSRSGPSRLRSALTGPAPRPVVLTVARLASQKGLAYLVEAAVGVPDALFVIAGEGPERAELEARARALGVEQRVRFLGFRTDVAELLASCDLFVLPSLFEGFPLAVLEAMASGAPVVASRIPGTDEAVVHGVTGWLVPPADPAALADAVRMLLSKPDLAARLAAAGAARVRQEFTVERMVERVSAVYDRLLGLRRTPVAIPD